MPLLGGLLAGLFGGLFQFLATFVARKTALAAAWVATFSALTVALVAAVSAAVTGLNLVVPSAGGVSTGFYLAAADVGLATGAVCIGVDALCWVYRWNVTNLALLARA